MERKKRREKEGSRAKEKKGGEKALLEGKGKRSGQIDKDKDAEAEASSEGFICVGGRCCFVREIHPCWRQ